MLSITFKTSWSRETIRGLTVADLVSAWEDFRDRTGIGNSDLLTKLKVKGLKTPEGLTRKVEVSYNGRVWENLYGSVCLELDPATAQPMRKQP